VCADDESQVRALEAAASDAGITLPVYVEVNMGGNRCGVEPGEPALQLATLIADAPHLAFAGLQAYHGSASICAAGASAARRSPRPSTEPGAPATCWQSRHRMPDYHRAGTGSFEFETVSGVYTELQCGSYIFMDADYGRNRDRDGEPTRVFEPSLFVWATVMSRPAEDRAIVDAGLKALAFDSAPPLVCDEPAATYERASRARPARGLGRHQPARARRQGAADPRPLRPTVNLYDWYVCVRGSRVEQLWPITARGAVY